ncbi:MAG TPA: TetR/AcrR family transcriptional regulator [Thermoanaerobaculia bacterium]|jgi:AcrR family transcriptional regulator
MVKPGGELPNTSSDTEERILEAANKVFVERGTAGARTEEIAREAGVNKALLHYYFRTKERLAEAVFERMAKAFFPQILQVIMSDLPIEEKVEQVVEIELTQLRKFPFIPGYLICEMNQHPDRLPQLLALIGVKPEAVRTQLFGKLRTQIREQVEAGTMVPIDPEQFMANLISLCIFPFAARPMLKAVLGMDDKAFGRFLDVRRKELAGFFLRGLRP